MFQSLYINSYGVFPFMNKHRLNELILDNASPSTHCESGSKATATRALDSRMQSAKGGCCAHLLGCHGWNYPAPPTAKDALLLKGVEFHHGEEFNNKFHFFVFGN